MATNFNNRFSIFLVFAIISLSWGCEDVIELDLKDAEPRLVIAAGLDVGLQTLDVQLSRSTPFYSLDSSSLVSDAQIELRSPTKTYTVAEIETGRYQATQIEAVSNDSFTLVIRVSDQSYEAKATVPTAAPLIDLEQIELSDLPFRDPSAVRLTALIEDDPTTKNYYRIQLFQSGENISEGFTVFDDIFAPIDTDFSVPIRETFMPKDTVQVRLLSTNKAYYDYFYQLALVTDPRSNDITPFNPQGNFDNNALGYFGIYHASILEKIIE